MKLSVIIPNRNDTVMLSITVRSALEELKALDNDGEIVIVDNSDEDIWRILRSPNISPLCLGYVESGRIQLIRQPFPSLYAARQTGIENARGEYVYNMDSHTVVGHNQLKALVDFMEGKKGTKAGFGFAPIGWISQHELYARHDLRIDQGTVFGNWGMQYDKPTKICWNFGSRICDREWYLNTLGGCGFYAKERISWGGEEMYIPVKGWLLGYESWAVPCAPQYHIGPFSTEIESRTSHRYRQYGSSGNGQVGIGVLAAFYALGGDEMKEEAYKAKKGLAQYNIDVDRDWPEAKRLAHNDWMWLKERQIVSFKEFMEQKPFNSTGWDEWKPYERIKKVVDLSKLVTIPL
jgi:glycosyltransferase involved in cell wall biosynthesis